MSRVLKTKENQITQEYGSNGHLGIDIVGKDYTLDTVIAHTDGTVVYTQDRVCMEKRRYRSCFLWKHGRH